MRWFLVEGQPWPARVLRYGMAAVAAGAAFGFVRWSVLAGVAFGGMFLVWLPIASERLLGQGSRRSGGGD